MVKCILHSIGLCDEPILSHIYLYTIYHSCASPDSLPRPSPVAVCHLKWHLQCLECLDAGNSRLLRRPNSDRCGHFEQLFLDYGSMCEKYKNRDIWACVWGKQLMLCILTVHLNPSLFILRQIAMAREVNKHAVWLALAADVFQLKAVWFYEFLSHCGGAWGSWSGGLGNHWGSGSVGIWSGSEGYTHIHVRWGGLLQVLWIG